MKILIVYTNYGTGHQRAAETLEDEIKTGAKDIIDILLKDVNNYRGEI